MSNSPFSGLFSDLAHGTERLRNSGWKPVYLLFQNAVFHHQPTWGQLAATDTFDKDLLPGFQSGDSGPLRAWKITTKVRIGHRGRVEPHHHPSLLHCRVFKNASDQYSLSGVFGVRRNLVVLVLAQQRIPLDSGGVRGISAHGGRLIILAARRRN